MEEYYRKRPRAQTADPPTPTEEGSGVKALSSEFDRYRQTLIEKDDSEGWQSELRRYLKDRPADVTKETDIVVWWQVSTLNARIILYFLLMVHRIMLYCIRHLRA